MRFWLSLTICVIFAVALEIRPLTSAEVIARDSWFDEYGKIKWSDEVIRLRNFEVSLRANPEMVGYIAFNWSCAEEYAEMKRRAERSRKYLVGVRKIASDRIVIVEGGKRKKPRIVLQPFGRSGPPPDFS